MNLYRQTSDSLRADLVTLGLERRAKPIPSLAEYLAKKDADRPSSKKDEGVCPSSESRPSSTYSKGFSSSSQEEMRKKEAPPVLGKEPS